MSLYCSSKTSQSIHISWKPPPLHGQNGKILGYKVFYENMNEYALNAEVDTKISVENTIEIHGLHKYSNYSVQIWAFTKVGDGVKSKPTFCLTEEDVPDAPAKVKVLSSSSTSLTVSWTSPAVSNGKITSYCVYWRAMEDRKGKDPMKIKVSSIETHYHITLLNKSGTYEVWVTASTKIGEGPPTHIVYATPSNRGVAGIISFGGEREVQGGMSITFPCLIMGQPMPTRIWSPLPLPENTQILNDGSIYVPSSKKAHQRNYTCSVVNPSGSDQITYSLRVILAPEPPVLMVTNQGWNWIELQWSVSDSSIRGFLLEVLDALDSGGEERIPRLKNSFTVENLLCGTQYKFRMRAYNTAGVGQYSDLVIGQTNGGKPGQPTYSSLFQINSTTISIHLNTWPDNGCPILSFIIEYKVLAHSHWITVGNNRKIKEKYDIVGLWPGKTYKVRLGATNSAGTTVVEYSVKTTQTTAEMIDSDSNKSYSEHSSIYFEPTVLMPITGFILTMMSVAITITICIRRKRQNRRHNGGHKDMSHQDIQSMVTLDNKTNLAQREQYYAALHKDMGTPMRDVQCERIPEYPNDISPYATFQVANLQATPQHSFSYQDRVFAAMETMPLKSGNLKDDYCKGRGGHKINKCVSTGSDYSGSTTDQWSEQGAVLRPERIPLHIYGGSNQNQESSSSPEQSPVQERRTPRYKHLIRYNGRQSPNPRVWGFQDNQLFKFQVSNRHLKVAGGKTNIEE